MAKNNKQAVESDNTLDGYDLDAAVVIRRLIRGDGSIELTLGFPVPDELDPELEPEPTPEISPDELDPFAPGA